MTSPQRKIDKVEVKIWPYYNNKLIVSGKVCSNSIRETERAMSFMIGQPKSSKGKDETPGVSIVHDFFRVIIIKAKASFYDEVNALNIQAGDCVLAIGKMTQRVYKKSDGTSIPDISVFADNIEILARGGNSYEKKENQFGF
jgi:hypothetical protein